MLADWQVDFGEGLRLVGGDAALGSWDVSSGPNMTWGEGHVWRTALRLPVGTSCEFKAQLSLPLPLPYALVHPGLIMLSGVPFPAADCTRGLLAQLAI